jgi:hypothetical protein
MISPVGASAPTGALPGHKFQIASAGLAERSWASSLTGADAAVAVLTATASNNLLKAAYTVGFTGHRRGLPVVGTLVLLSGVAVLIGFVLTRH